ncbi:response regulator [Candidatus Saccharibacteria bacterium]|nr:response regulator [Candidatus Saccharibacteria bacterium]
MQDEEDKQVQELRDIENNFDMPESAVPGVDTTIDSVASTNGEDPVVDGDSPATNDEKSDIAVPPMPTVDGISDVPAASDDAATANAADDGDSGVESNTVEETPLSVPVVESDGDAQVDDTVQADTGVDQVSVDSSDTKKKILLVEDDEALATVYRSRLELEGFEVFEVHNGEEALQSAKDVRPDLILLDAMMPKVSGFDVLDILRQTPETVNVRVIMLTALSQPKDKEKAEALGVDDYLVKSQVVIGDVVERVKHHLAMD